MNRLRVEETTDALNQHITRDREEQYCIECGNQNFKAAINESALVVGRTLNDFDRSERTCKRSGVGKHMRCVRKQREAVEQECAHQFCDEKNRRERQCDSELFSANTRAAVVACVSALILSMLCTQATASLLIMSFRSSRMWISR